MQHDIGKRIKNVRRTAKLTQKELGQAIGVAEITIRQYENGQRQPKIETLQRIAAALGVSVIELLGAEQRSEVVQRHMEKYINDNPHATVIESGENIGFRITGEEEAQFRLEKTITAYEKLNPVGRDKAYEYILDLSEIPKYRWLESKEDPPSDD